MLQKPGGRKPKLSSSEVCDRESGSYASERKLLNMALKDEWKFTKRKGVGGAWTCQTTWVSRVSFLQVSWVEIDGWGEVMMQLRRNQLTVS